MIAHAFESSTCRRSIAVQAWLDRGVPGQGLQVECWCWDRPICTSAFVSNTLVHLNTAKKEKFLTFFNMQRFLWFCCDCTLHNVVQVTKYVLFEFGRWKAGHHWQWWFVRLTNWKTVARRSCGIWMRHWHSRPGMPLFLCSVPKKHGNIISKIISKISKMFKILTSDEFADDELLCFRSGIVLRRLDDRWWDCRGARTPLS